MEIVDLTWSHVRILHAVHRPHLLLLVVKLMLWRSSRWTVRRVVCSVI
jgi:hypothetical protein